VPSDASASFCASSLLSINQKRNSKHEHSCRTRSLLVTRSSYIDRAVDLKKIESLPARTTDRVAEVLDRVRAAAAEKGLDPALAAALWSELIEWSIQKEIKELGA
jgi:isochorismate pyruvate lyase